ncbi:MAG: hypothetical protein RLZZ283_263 [Candidatus Parcubacteria bacterium]|jgi:uncharacterized membrane protein
MFRVALYGALVLTVFVTGMPHAVFAEAGDTIIVHGKVIQAGGVSVTPILGTEAVERIQTLSVELDAGSVVTFTNDHTPLSVGDRVYLNAQDMGDRTEYTFKEFDRRLMLIVVAVLFVLLTVFVGGVIGFRAIVALGISLAVIVYVLLPMLVSGAPPALTSLFVSALILASVMAITHGINRSTAAAFIGSMITVIIAIIVSSFVVTVMRFSGFTDDASSILNLSTGGTLDMAGLLLGAIIIGILGIIDDLAVTQVITVQELRCANAALSHRDVYQRAMHIGRSHLGAVVNTLVLAYAGASLPLLLLFTLSASDTGMLLNSEIVAVEIVRAIIGTGALALVLPISTALAVYLPKNLLIPKNGLKSSVHGHSH